MRRKYLAIGISIITVVLLTLTSFSNVVGYQSVKSTTVNDSPLFQTRTQRATNQQQNILTSRYLGMELNHRMMIPIILDETETLSHIINRIRAMDEVTFHRFVNYVLYQIKNKNNFKDINVEEFASELQQLKESKQSTIIFKDSNDDKKIYFNNLSPTANGYSLYCNIFVLLYSIIVFLKWILIPTSNPWCYGSLYSL